VPRLASFPPRKGSDSGGFSSSRAGSNSREMQSSLLLLLLLMLMSEYFMIEKPLFLDFHSCCIFFDLLIQHLIQ
jgi:hypothetical protein